MLSEDKDEMVDVESYSAPPDLPYQVSKVTTIMNECSAHMNLIRVAPDNPDLEMDRSAPHARYMHATCSSHDQ